jgi:hypothetical protein
MSIFSCVFQDQKNEFVLGKRTLNGSLLKMAGIPDRMGRFPINKEDSCPEIFGIK